MEQEYQRKSLKFISDNKPSPDESVESELQELKAKLTELEKDLFKKQKEKEFLERENKSFQQELGLRAGFIETMQLESCAAIEDEKSKAKILLGKNEVAMREYFESKLQSRDSDNESLRKQLTEKESDLRSIVLKYNQL